MAVDRSKVEYAKKYLRRKYAGNNAGLATLADEVFAEATDTVTLTGTSFEGGSGSGQITFEKALLGAAVEEVLEEQANALLGYGRASRYVIPDFRRAAAV